jgi:DNA-binding SARP family transcriptional activator
VSAVHVQLFGRFQVRCAGDEVPPAAFGGRKVRTLLRILAIRRPDLVPHGVLAEALWPGRMPADPAGNLAVLANRARKALGDPGLIVTGAGGYALGECTVDVAQFRAAVEAAGAAGQDHAAVLRACVAALALWGEPLVEDRDAEWAREERERLNRAWLEVVERGARAALALGDARRAVALASELVSAEPLRESGVLLLARALAAHGDPAAALCRIAALRTRLAEELGVDPAPEVQRLQLALLRGEMPAFKGVAAPAPVPIRAPVFAELAFVGRDEELARVQAGLVSPGLVTLAGPAGSGKSRLLAELSRTMSVPLIAARAFLPERAEAWSLARSLLREALAVDPEAADGLPRRAREALSGLLPELATGPPIALDGESRRALVSAGAVRLFEAATHAEAVLVVDDLQWADPSSVMLLGSVLARLPRLGAVLAFRPEELSAGLLDELRSAGGESVEVLLGGLPTVAVQRLVGDPDLARAVLEGTDRTPFAVAELLRELVARDAITAAPRGGWTVRAADVATLAVELGRAGQRRAVARRAARQTGKRGEVLAFVALLARETPARVIAAAAGLEQASVLAELSALDRAGLVRLGEGGWASGHDLVAETVTEALPGGERGRLHALLARALDAEGADLSEVAHHHRQAGDAGAAAEAYRRAAEGALDAHATREAHALSSAGLDLQPRSSVRAGLLAVRAEAAAAHGDLAPAIADLRESIATSEAGPPRARRLARLAMLTFGSQDMLPAAELAELALVEAADDSGARAAVLETAAILDMNSGRRERAEGRSEEAVGIYRSLGDARGVARILDGRAMATFLDGGIADAVEVFARVAQLFTDSGELLRVVTPRSTRGHGLVFMGRPGEGLTETTAALRLARDLDAPEGQAYALWHRSEALSGLGRAAQAEADAREALAIATTLGHRGWMATAYRALGIALASRGELDDAADSFTASAAVAGESLGLFASWAAAQAALVAIARGELAGVDAMVARALALGPPLGHYEARLAQVELAAARADPHCPSIAARALAHARQGGHAVSARRLAELAGAAAQPGVLNG